MLYNPDRINNILNKLDLIPDDQRGEVALKVLREFYLSDFFFFAKRFLQYKDLEWDVHGQFIKVFESKADRKIVVMPRGTFKSTLGSVAYPIWRLLKDPNLTILLDSELFGNSKNFLREIKGHLESDRMNKIFGVQIGKKWDESEIILAGRTRIRKEGSITVGGIGTTKVGQHYDLIIGDDYNSPQNSETPEKCQKVIDHVRYNLNILNPGGEYLFIGTRYAERDVIGFFLAEILGEKNLAEGKLELMQSKVLKVEEEILGG